MDLKLLESVCQQLKTQEYEVPALVPPKKEMQKTVEIASEPDPNVTISKLEVENLFHFAQIWTDVLEIEEVQEQFEKSKYDDRLQFEKDNNIHNLGFFYVKVNTECSAIEFLGLLAPIPFEQFRSPNSDQISYAVLSKLFGEGSEKATIQLMVLGSYFQYWALINPFSLMKNTADELTKLIICGMGSLAILIVPNYIQTCYKLVKNTLNNASS